MSETPEHLTNASEAAGGSQSNPKPGWKTTEFWITVAIALAAFGEQLAGVLPPEYAVTIVAISGAIYKITRALKTSGGAK